MYDNNNCVEPVLIRDHRGVGLRYEDMFLMGDFVKMIPRLNPGIIKDELLVKAAKIKGKTTGLTVLDCTAGLGEDSILLAAAGFTVKLYEYNPVIFELLKDAVKRGMDNHKLTNILSRMELFNLDSVQALSGLDEPPDIVYLDPMFPERSKNALAKKKFQLLQKLESPSGNEEALLNAAIDVHPKKIIIKRPLKGPYLGDIKPNYSLKGKIVRYDCIL